jgi:hypothetical protein
MADYKEENRLPKFLTNVVFNFLFIGCVLIILSQLDIYKYMFNLNDWMDHVLKGTFKLVGGALIGSGVFTAIIKSNSYTNIFSNIIGEIIWSQKFIERRSDKMKIWSMVSKIIYEAKFPRISDAIEEIITSEYLPIDKNYYLDDYEFTVNITDHNQDFWNQNETISFTIIPKSNDFEFEHTFATSIQLPPSGDGLNDLTDFKVTRIMVNGVDWSGDIPQFEIKDGYLRHSFPVSFKENCGEYRVSLQREKTVYKKSNLDKRLFMVTIVNNMKLTLITNNGMHIDFHKMGTVKEFITIDPQINSNTKIMSWIYKGLILPHQGLIVIIKL